jgi:hypothetical protein
MVYAAVFGIVVSAFVGAKVKTCKLGFLFPVRTWQEELE